MYDLGCLVTTGRFNSSRC